MFSRWNLFFLFTNDNVILIPQIYDSIEWFSFELYRISYIFFFFLFFLSISHRYRIQHAIYSDICHICIGSIYHLIWLPNWILTVFSFRKNYKYVCVYTLNAVMDDFIPIKINMPSLSISFSLLFHFWSIDICLYRFLIYHIIAFTIYHNSYSKRILICGSLIYPTII